MIKKCINFFILLILAFKLHAEEKTSAFFMPWNDTTTAIVIDPYYGNSIDWEQLATDKRVVAIIHKASEGLKTDSEYAARKAEALKRGYLWGSYHLGRPGDPITQAEHYLKVAQPGAHEMMALDLEALNSKFMTLEQAEQFINYIALKTGRYPLLYVNHVTAKQISKLGPETIFAKLPLWYARFRKDLPDFPTTTWKSYALWQFSSEINCKAQDQCLYNVAGTRYDMDINVFFGTAEELRSQWPLTPAMEYPSLPTQLISWIRQTRASASFPSGKIDPILFYHYHYLIK